MKDEPAFPLPFIFDPTRGMNGEYIDAGDAGVPCGLTKREYFAVMAMQGMCAGECWGENITTNPELHVPVCEIAVKMADALIEALEKQS